MLGNEDFLSEASFVSAFTKEVLIEIAAESRVSEEIRAKLSEYTVPDIHNGRLSALFLQLSEWCAKSEQAIVLIIDEVDSASNNQVFLDFLAQLRGYFLARTTRGRATFQSVVLAGVYNIKNLKLKANPDTEHKLNSPWNIATDFTMDMSFDARSLKKQRLLPTCKSGSILPCWRSGKNESLISPLPLWKRPRKHKTEYLGEDYRVKDGWFFTRFVVHYTIC